MHLASRRIVVLVVLGLLACSHQRTASAQETTNRPPRGLVRSLGSTGFRHPSAIEFACLDPTGKTLYTLSYKGVYAWNLQTGESRLLFHAERVRNALSISPDGRHIATIAGDGPGIWDARTGAFVREFPESFGALSVAYQRGGKGVVIFREGSIERRPLGRGESRIIGPTARHCWPVYSPDGKWFATSASEDTPWEIQIYDADRARKRATLQVGDSVRGQSPSFRPILRAGFSADGKRIAVPAVAGTISVWDIDASKIVRVLRPGAGRRSPEEANCAYLLFSTDGRQLYAGTPAGSIRRWDVETSRELAPFRAPQGAVSSLHLIDGGTILVSTHADGTIRRWDLAAGKEVPPPAGYTGSLHARLSPDGASVLLLDATGRMDIWNLADGRLRTPVRATGEIALDTPWVAPHFGFTPDGKRVFLAELNGKISIYEAADGKPAGSLTLPGYVARPRRDLRFCISTPDGRAFVVNRGPQVMRLVRASNGEGIWESPDVSLGGLCFPPVIAPDGTSLYLGVTTGEKRPNTEPRGRLELVRLDLATGKVLSRTELETHSGGDMAFFDQPRLSRDGRALIILYFPNEPYIADPATGKALHHHVLFLDHPALSPDGKRIVSMDLKDLAVFDAATGRPISHLSIGQQTVRTLDVLPDGRHVFTAGDGGHACLWDLNAALPARTGAQGSPALEAPAIRDTRTAP